MKEETSRLPRYPPANSTSIREATSRKAREVAHPYFEFVCDLQEPVGESAEVCHPPDVKKVLAVHEDVSVVDKNIDSGLSTGDSSTNADGEFLDALVLLGTSPSAIPANACAIDKQSITVTGNSKPIRVNCIQYSATDVTITDVTSNPSQCSKPTYHCN
jgi:hypothetical protein